MRAVKRYKTVDARADQEKNGMYIMRTWASSTAGSPAAKPSDPLDPLPLRQVFGGPAPIHLGPQDASAARVQAQSDANEIYLTEEMLSIPGAEEILAAFATEARSVQLKGVQGHVRVHRVHPKVGPTVAPGAPPASIAGAPP